MICGEVIYKLLFLIYLKDKIIIHGAETYK